MTRNGRELTCHSVSFTNSDPEMIKVFLRFLREICEVPESKIQAHLRIYKHLSEAEVIKYWKEITSINQNNFKKSYCGISKSSQNKKPYNRLQYGTIQIRVNDTNLFHKITGWIEGIKENAAVAQWKSATLNSLGHSVVIQKRKSGEFGGGPDETNVGGIPSQAEKGTGFSEGVETRE